MKEKTKSMTELKDLPVEILAKIFNYLPNHDVRCGISLACKQFYEICQDQSLVPVKDLCIHGRLVAGGKKHCKHYGLSNIDAVSDIILQSQNLTTLKIKKLDFDSVDHLVSIARQACPKLIHLEITFEPKMFIEQCASYKKELSLLIFSKGKF